MSLESLTGVIAFNDSQPSEALLIAQAEQLNEWCATYLSSTVAAIGVLVTEAIPALQAKINAQEYYVAANPLEYRVAVNGDALNADQRSMIAQMCACTKFLKHFHAIKEYNDTFAGSSAIKLSQVHKIGNSYMLGFIVE